MKDEQIYIRVATGYDRDGQNFLEGDLIGSGRGQALSNRGEVSRPTISTVWARSQLGIGRSLGRHLGDRESGTLSAAVATKIR